MIIVDDGSEDIYSIDKFISPTDKIKLYRVPIDYGFNSHGCRNLIMKEASNEFVILADSDRIIYDVENTIASIKKRKTIKKNRRYKFVSHLIKLGNSTHESVNDYLISKTHFFKAGGYDEELIGVRTGDREYFKQLMHYGYEKILYDVDIILTCGATVSIKDKEKKTRRMSKNDVRESREVKKLIDSRIKNPDPNKKILTFEWFEIT